MSKPNWLDKNTIFLTLAGSHLYGMSMPQSDIDKRGVCIPPKNVVIGFANNFEQYEDPVEDTIIYGLTKFMSLAAQCNPNIVELMFAPDKTIEIQQPIWKELVNHKYKFLTARAYKTFSGYAHGQLARIRSHRSHLLTPPDHKPTREEYGLTQTGQGIRELGKGIDLLELDPNLGSLISKERQYKEALTKWNQYEDWKQNRNPIRAKLEAEHSYDTKHAAHLIRLLRMGKEILTTGQLNVVRPDAPELLAIRNGSLTYDKLIEETDLTKAELDQIYENKSYVVPEKPDMNFLSDLCVELHDKHWQSN